jgi:hypothetical protein
MTAPRKRREETRTGTGDETTEPEVTSDCQKGCMTLKENGNERGQAEKWDAGFHVYAYNLVLNFIIERAKNTMIAQGWFGDKQCLVTVVTGACVIIARIHMVAGANCSTGHLILHSGLFFREEDAGF